MPNPLTAVLCVPLYFIGVYFESVLREDLKKDVQDPAKMEYNLLRLVIALVCASFLHYTVVLPLLHGKKSSQTLLVSILAQKQLFASSYFYCNPLLPVQTPMIQGATGLVVGTAFFYLTLVLFGAPLIE